VLRGPWLDLGWDPNALAVMAGVLLVTFGPDHLATAGDRDVSAFGRWRDGQMALHRGAAAWPTRPSSSAA